MENTSVVHKFDEKTIDSSQKSNSNGMKKISFFIFFLVIVFGFITGGGLYLLTNSRVVSVPQGANMSKIPVGTVFGSDDEKLFSDEAQGALRVGGVNGEGTHHLERPGGESQNVYLTSSVINLSKLEGKTIKVWGKTYQAQTAGWFMDVGRAQILK